MAHKRWHAGDKPFRCDVCGVGYSDKGSLKKHVKRKHLNPSSESPQANYLEEIERMARSKENVGTQNDGNPSFRMPVESNSQQNAVVRVEDNDEVQFQEGFPSGHDPLTENVEFELVIDSDNIARMEPVPKIVEASPSASTSLSAASARLKSGRKKRARTRESNNAVSRDLGPCEFCGKTFADQWNLKLHTYTHTGERPLKCHLCPKAFMRSHHLKAHLRSHNGEKREPERRNELLCQFCGKRFRRSRNLKRHIYMHTGERPYKCDLCPKAFRRTTNLQHHLMSHSGKKPFICPRCGKGFTRKSYLEAHERSHSGVKPFPCEVCGVGYIHKHTLKTHLKRKHSRKVESAVYPATCPQKQISFESVTEVGSLEETSFLSRGHGQQSLPDKDSPDSRKNNESIDIAHNISPSCTSHLKYQKRKKGTKTCGPRKFGPCELCGKTFQTAQNLQHHMYMHTGERPYKCHICPRAFKRSDHRGRHLRRHSGVKLGGLTEREQFSADHNNFALPDMASPLADEQIAPGNSQIGIPAQENLLPPTEAAVAEVIEMEFSFVPVQFVEYNHALSMENNYVENRVCREVPAPNNDLPHFVASTTPLESQRKKRGRNFGPCQFCGKTFQSTKELRLHVYIHTGERPYKCHLCPKAFKQQPHLDIHLRSHSGERPFLCPSCGKGFSKNHSLKVHERRHTGGKP